MKEQEIAKERIEDKLDNMREHIKDKHIVIWVVTNEKMAKFIQDQINNYGWYKEAHKIEIFNI